MTIKNHDQEIEKRYHPENFDEDPIGHMIYPKSPKNSVSQIAQKFFDEVIAIKYLMNPKPIRIKKSAHRGSAKEARSIQHKHRMEK